MQGWTRMARWGAFRKAVALTTAGLLAASPSMIGSVHARDDAGIHAFFASEARPATSAAALPPRPTATPAHQGMLPFASKRTLIRSQPREAVVRLPPKTRARFAALPRSEEQAKARQPAMKPVRLESDEPAGKQPSKPSYEGDPVSALLADKTLRAGDIVVVEDGPKVFKGDKGGKAHLWSSFEEGQSSKLLSKSDRKLVASLTKSPSSPGKEPARYVPRTEVASALTPGEQTQSVAAIRIVYPSGRQ